MQLRYNFSFDAAHHLPHVPNGHKCGRVHGHTYSCSILVAGPVDPHMGWIVDFALLKATISHVDGKLDHRLLNDIPGLENPTSENLVKWIWDKLQEWWPNCKARLVEVTVSETPNTMAIYHGPEAAE